MPAEVCTVLDPKYWLAYKPTSWWQRWLYERELEKNGGDWDFSNYEPLEKWDRNLCFQCYRKQNPPDIWQSELIRNKRIRMMPCCVTNSHIPVRNGPPDECPFHLEHYLKTQGEQKHVPLCQ